MASSVDDLEHFRRCIASIDVASLNADDLGEVLAEARKVQRVLEGFVARIAARADSLAVDGRSAPSDELLRARGGVSARQARLEARRAHVIARFPELGPALDDGATTGEHLDALARTTDGLTAEQLAPMDRNELLNKATALPVETFQRSVKRTVDAITDYGRAGAVTDQDRSELRCWFDQTTGMGRITAALDPERYEIVSNAIEHHMKSLCATSAESQSMNPNLAAAALVDLVAGGVVNTRKRLPSILVVVDRRTLAQGPHPGSIRQTETGHDLAPEAVARLCCDATLQRVTLEDGVPIDVGRKYRTATDAQWAAIKAIHPTCAWSGCSAPITWCQLHHIDHWEAGGPTNLDNLVPLCSRHHHRVHEGRWSVKLLPDRTLDIFTPNGTHHTTVPTPQRC